jgi:hypothetical protein
MLRRDYGSIPSRRHVFYLYRNIQNSSVELTALYLGLKRLQYKPDYSPLLASRLWIQGTIPPLLHMTCPESFTVQYYTLCARCSASLCTQEKFSFILMNLFRNRSIYTKQSTWAPLPGTWSHGPSGHRGCWCWCQRSRLCYRSDTGYSSGHLYSRLASSR